jgi:hypothetical protein
MEQRQGMETPDLSATMQLGRVLTTKRAKHTKGEPGIAASRKG